MSVLEPLAVSIAISLFLYFLFYLWYERFPRRPLSAAEVEAYLDKIAALRGNKGTGANDIIERLRALCQNDDGHEFYMVNMIRQRSDVPEAAKDRFPTMEAAWKGYMKAWARASVPRGAHPIFRGTPYVLLFGQPQQERLWDLVSLMRYRSRRDFMNILIDPAFARDSAMKAIVVEYTDVYPSQVNVMPSSPRRLVFLLLLSLSLIGTMLAYHA